MKGHRVSDSKVHGDLTSKKRQKTTHHSNAQPDHSNSSHARNNSSNSNHFTKHGSSGQSRNFKTLNDEKSQKLPSENRTKQHNQSKESGRQDNAHNKHHPVISPLYESLLTARAIISSLEIDRYNQELVSALQTLLQQFQTFSRQAPSSPLTTGIDITECSQAFQSLRTFANTLPPLTETNRSHRNRWVLKVVMLLDDCYYTLYNCVELHSRMMKKGEHRGGGGGGGGGHLPVPPPHVYFPITLQGYSGYKERLSTQFQTFLNRNILSTTNREKLQAVWGFDPFQPLILQAQSIQTMMKKNPLLSLHFTRWKESCALLTLLDIIPNESDVMTMLTSCQSQQHAESGASLTMKGTDPLLPSLLREYNDACRIWPCRFYAFATPNIAAIQRLTTLLPIVEIGAGTGYWSHMIRTHSTNNNGITVPPALAHTLPGSGSAGAASVQCYDKDPPPAAHIPLNNKQSQHTHNEYHGRSKAWTQVLKGGPEVLAHLPASYTLFLCYPPPDSQMALLALRGYAGDYVCYVGEWQGDTGTKAFEKLLCESFVCEEVLPLPNWGDTCYMMMIWKRRNQGSDKEKERVKGKGKSNEKSTVAVDMYSNHRTFPMLCSTCGNRQNSSSSESQTTSSVALSSSLPLHRCRLSYNIYFCSASCAIEGRSLHLEELAMKYLLQHDVEIKKDDEVATAVEEMNSSTTKKRKRQFEQKSNNNNSSGSNGSDSNSDERVNALIPLSTAHYIRVQSPRLLVAMK